METSRILPASGVDWETTRGRTLGGLVTGKEDVLIKRRQETGGRREEGGGGDKPASRLLAWKTSERGVGASEFCSTGKVDLVRRRREDRGGRREEGGGGDKPAS